MPETLKNLINAQENLQIGDIHPKQAVKNNVITLIIEGKLSNPTQSSVTVPKLKALIKDDNNNIIRSWKFTAERSIIQANSTLNFSTELPSPPDNGTIVAVEFAATS